MRTELIDLKALKEAADFERVLAHYGIPLKGTGEQRTALCLFHAKTKGSFKVNLRRKLFNCFGCKAHGNVLDFVMQKEQLNEPQAATKIAEICGLTLPVKTGDDRPHVKRTITSADARKTPEVSEPPLRPETPATDDSRAPDDAPTEQAGLPESEINPPLTLTLKLKPDHPYLGVRGPLPEMVARFGLGGAERGMMHGRICIPLHNERGELIAYAGRYPGEPPEGVPRYLFPPKFRKSHALFNLHRVAGCRHLVLVEGFWSVFRLHSLRIPAVALMGTALSAEQETLLAASGVRAITLMLDGDQAGRTAAAEMVPRLAGWCFVRRADLPDGSQPDTIDEAELIRFAR